MAAALDKGSDDEAEELRQLKLRLQELEWSAKSRGLWLTATLIGAAFESLSDELRPCSKDPDEKVSEDGSDMLKHLRIERPNF